MNTAAVEVKRALESGDEWVDLNVLGAAHQRSPIGNWIGNVFRSSLHAHPSGITIKIDEASRCDSCHLEGTSGRRVFPGNWEVALGTISSWIGRNETHTEGVLR